MRKKVVFFSPHAGIWPHSLAESFMAKCLDPEKNEVVRIKCDGTFKIHCTVMEASGLAVDENQSQKDKVCKKCIKNSKILRQSYAGDDYLISDYISKDDLTQLDKIFNGSDEIDIRKLTYLGVEVGRIASYEALIKFKKTSLDFTSEENDYFLTYVRNAILSLMAFYKIFKEVQPDILICYSPQYAVLGVCARYCELKGKRVYFIEGSANIEERYKALRVWDWTEFGLTNPALKYWKNVDKYNLSKEDFERSKLHINRLLKADSFSVYSKPATGKFNLRTHFGISSNVKIVLAAMSSYDEVFSAYHIGRFPNNKYLSNVFKDQLEWIKRTISFFSTHPELFLIIRIHPRTFPSNRNKIMAQEQIELSKLMISLPQNVRVNYPADNISIYDLYHEIDALVTGWSATGVEAMIFNVPVITYDHNLPSFPSSIHYTGESQREYFQNLIRAISDGKNENISNNARRWLAFSMSVGVVRHPSMFIRSSVIGKMLFRALRLFFSNYIKQKEAGQHVCQIQARYFNDLLETGRDSFYDVNRLFK
jgi:hypothetical protein